MLERANWARVAREVTNAADTGNMKRAFAVLNEALGRGGKEGATPESELRAAARGAIQSLTQDPPTHPLDMPDLPQRPMEDKTQQTHIFPVFTDGSKYHSRRRPRAGAGVWFPEFNETHSCQVPKSMRQTSAAGEVCAILLALRLLRHLPSSTTIHIVSDNAYCVFVLQHQLEILQQQDFSDSSHPDIWREIVRELVSFPHKLTAEWTKSHTDGEDPNSIGNAIADRVAKMAAKGNPSKPPPSIDTEPVVAPVRGSLPTKLESDHAVDMLQRTAAAGLDRILANVLRTEEGKRVVYDIIKEVWEKGELPEGLAMNLLTFIPKANGQPRPITLVNTVVKVIMNIIRNRLKVLPLLPTQYGFQRARDVGMAIRVLRSAMRRARRHGKYLFAVFVDIRDAYNSCCRDTLWEVLGAHGVPPNIVGIIKSTYASETWVKDTDISFFATSGVRQGCPAAPDCYNLVTDAAIRESTLINAPHNCLLWADDLVIFGESMEEVQSHLSSFEEQATRLGLTLNTLPGKTEAICFLTETHGKRWKAHEDAKAANVGAFSGNPFSSTADTHNGLNYITPHSATHLWCPKCAYTQKDCTTSKKAFELLKTHMRKDHPHLRLEQRPEGVFRTCAFMPAPPSFLPREPITAFPDVQFHLIRDDPAHGIAPCEIRWVERYKYLGHILDFTGFTNAAVYDRYVKALHTFHGLSKLWTLRKMETRLKMWLLDSMVVPKLLFGLASVVPSLEDMELLESFHAYVLQTITGKTLEDPWGRKVTPTYPQLLMWGESVSIGTQLRKQRLALAGRMTRANRDHPMRHIAKDEWDALVQNDLVEMQMSQAVLEDRYLCKKILHSPNVHLGRPK